MVFVGFTEGCLDSAVRELQSSKGCLKRGQSGQLKELLQWLEPQLSNAQTLLQVVARNHVVPIWFRCGSGFCAASQKPSHALPILASAFSSGKSCTVPVVRALSGPCLVRQVRHLQCATQKRSQSVF